MTTPSSPRSEPTYSDDTASLTSVDDRPIRATHAPLPRPRPIAIHPAPHRKFQPPPELSLWDCANVTIPRSLCRPVAAAPTTTSKPARAPRQRRASVPRAHALLTCRPCSPRSRLPDMPTRTLVPAEHPPAPPAGPPPAAWAARQRIKTPLALYKYDHVRLDETLVPPIEIGIDEVGRGPLFGRAYVAAVVLPRDPNLFDVRMVKDSKKFSSEASRRNAAEYVRSHALAWAVVHRSESDVDASNITKAILSAMHEAARRVIAQLAMQSVSGPTATDGSLDDYARAAVDLAPRIQLLVDGSYFEPMHLSPGTVANRATACALMPEAPAAKRARIHPPAASTDTATPPPVCRALFSEEDAPPADPAVFAPTRRDHAELEAATHWIQHDPRIQAQLQGSAAAPIAWETVVKGDATLASIAAASILAKVARDDYIAEMCQNYPELQDKYEIADNKGYGTEAHIQGLEMYGVTPWHRRTFRPCSELLV